MRNFLIYLLGAIGLALPGYNVLAAGSPIISYTPSSNTYTVGTTITTLTPGVTNGVSAFGFGTGTTLTGATLNNPRGMAIDASGNVYVANSGNNTISKYNSSGTYVGTFGSGATMSFPKALVFDSSGNAYVLNLGATAGTGSVYKYNSSGVYQATLLSGLNYALGLTIDASDNIYVADQGATTVKKYSTSGALLLSLPATNLSTPLGVAVDASGNIYVANNGTGNVTKYNSAGTFLSTFLTGYTSLQTITIDGAGNIYIGDNATTNVVKVYNQSATLLTSKAINDPEGIVVDSKGNMFTTAYYANQVNEYAPTGGFFLNKALPAGLSFNSSNGSISGTPTAAMAATTYTVTAYNASGSGNTTVTITVNLTTNNWNGSTSTDWNTTSNWSRGTVPGSGDAVQIGVSTSFKNQPLISSGATNTIGSLTIGTNNSTLGSPVTLTVNSSNSLTVTGAITQNPSGAGSYTTKITGAGSITCASLNVGDNSTLPPLGSYLLNFVSTINSLQIAGNVAVNSTSDGITALLVGYNNATFSLQGGTTSIGGTILTANTNYGVLTGASATPTFSIDMPTGSSQTPVLQLTNAAPINTSSVAGTIDFYNNTGGTGTCTVIYNYSGSLTQTVYTNNTTSLDNSPKTYQYLQITGSGTGAETPNSSSLLIDKDLTTSATSVLLNTNNPTVTVGNSWTNTGSVTQGSGNITVTNALQNTSGTFQLGTGNLTTATLQNSGGTIAGGAGPGVVTVSGTFQNNGGTYQCAAEDLYINGSTYQNTSTFTAGTGTVYFNGTVAQSLSDISTTGTQFNTVSFSGTSLTNAKTMSGSGGFSVSTTGILKMVGATTKLDAGGVLTLKSGAISTASVDVISSGSLIIGTVNVERYISGSALKYRGYRFLSSPVYTATASGNYYFDLSYLSTYAPITGTLGTSGGMSKVGNPTIYLYRGDILFTNKSYNGGNFRGVNKINNSPLYTVGVDGDGDHNLYAGNGFWFFYRGNTTNIATKYLATTVPESNVFVSKGTLNQQTVTFKHWYTDASTLQYVSVSGNAPTYIGYNMVGNPYASSIDWNTFSTSNATAGIYGPSVGNSIYIYNETTKVYGIYDGTTGTNGASNIIPSGQGFYVKATGASAQLIFHESAKTSAQVTGPTQATGPTLLLSSKPVKAAAPVQYLRLQMAKDSDNVEETIVRFENTAKNEFVDGEDSEHMSGSGAVSFSSKSSNNINLGINHIPFPKAPQTVIKLNVSATADGQYTISKTELKNVPDLYEIWLMDALKKDSLDIKHNATYKFDVLKSDTNTYGSNRFSLVIRQNKALGVHLLDFTAAKAANGVPVTWKTENEEDYTNFTVERSTDNGATFNVLGGFTSNSQQVYTFLDASPAKTVDLYRLKLEDLNGSISYSNVITIVYDQSKLAAADINVYPNPAIGVINLAINKNNSLPSNPVGLQNMSSSSVSIKNASAVSYAIKIVNILGTVVKSVISPKPNWQDDVSSLLPGTYIIQVVNSRDKSLVGKATFVKL